MIARHLRRRRQQERQQIAHPLRAELLGQLFWHRGDRRRVHFFDVGALERGRHAFSVSNGDRVTCRVYDADEHAAVVQHHRVR